MIKFRHSKLVLPLYAKLFGPKNAARYIVRKYLRDKIDYNSQYHILTCSRHIFSKDIKELKRNIETIDFLAISNSVLASIQSAWIPKHARIQTYYYSKLPKDSIQWKKSATFFKEIIKLLSEAIAVDGIMAANFDYWQDAALREICSVTKIPFIVLRRENEVTNKSVHIGIERYKNVEIGSIDLLMVFSQKCKDFASSISSDGLHFNNIVVTGPPRLDNVKEKLKLFSVSTEEKKQITLFSYLNGNYSEDPNNFWEVLNAVHSIVKENNYILLIKCKSKGDLHSIKEGAKKLLPNIDNIEWTAAKSTVDAVMGSVCVIGYNSTVLLELLPIPINIVVPFIYTTVTERQDDILHEADQFDESGVIKVTSMEVLHASVRKIIKSKGFFVYNKNREELRDKYLSWEPNYISSYKVRDAIINTIKRN